MHARTKFVPVTLRVSRGVLVAVAISTAVACLGDPSGPFGHQLVLSPESLSFEALGDSARVSAAEVGPRGAALQTPTIEYSSAAPSVVTIDSTGLVISRGNGVTWIIARTASGDTDSIPVAVIQQPSGVVASGDTLRFHSLGAQRPLGAMIVDRLGAPISGLPLEYGVLDTSVAAVSADGRVEARRNGVTIAHAWSAGESLSVVIQVNQRPMLVVTASDTVRFVAFGDTATAAGIAVDSLGHTVLEAGVANLSIDDSTVLEIVDSVKVRAKQNGRTVIRFFVGGLPVEQQAVVAQVPDTIVASIADTLPILSLDRDSLIPLHCEVRDRNGYAIPLEASIDGSGVWSGTTCGNLRARQSGLATMLLRAGAVTTTVSVAIALRPVVSSTLGTYLAVDSLPSGTGAWSPTLRRNEAGELELYVTGYAVDSIDVFHTRGPLYRFLSSDGINFRYDGVALQLDDSLCDLNGSGIENVAVVPRADGPGWRMFYASGSFSCYGWQVFSAISIDRRTWIKEAGVRLTNGGSLPPDPPIPSPWPVGEGMVVEQLSTGEWRMLVGGYRHLQAPEDKFHIVEWRSSDQSTWRYIGPVLTTDDFPATGQRSVYSPTVREFAPGLWRMIVTADNLPDVGGRSRLWSAVSTDKQHWQLEGELMGAVGTDLYYSSLVDTLLVFLRLDAGQPRRLASVTVDMP